MAVAAPKNTVITMARQKNSANNKPQELSISDVVKCPDSEDFFCYKDTPLYHQAQFFIYDTDDTKSCVLHSVNNIIGYSAYNGVTWSQYWDKIFANKDTIKIILERFKKTLDISVLYDFENPLMIDTITGWINTLSREFENPKELLKELLNVVPYIFEYNREYAISEALFLLLFQNTMDGLVFRPFQLINYGDLGKVHIDTFSQYIETINNNWTDMLYGSSKRGGHAIAYKKVGDSIYTIDSMIWRSQEGSKDAVAGEKFDRQPKKFKIDEEDLGLNIVVNLGPVMNMDIGTINAGLKSIEDRIIAVIDKYIELNASANAIATNANANYNANDTSSVPEYNQEEAEYESNEYAEINALRRKLTLKNTSGGRRVTLKNAKSGRRNRRSTRRRKIRRLTRKIRNRRTK